MTKNTGRFIWYELLTDDVQASVDFYEDVVGWTASQTTMGGVSYTIFNTGRGTDLEPVAAVIDLKREDSLNATVAGWIGYIGVESVDTTLEQVLSLGGTPLQDPVDAPEIGRFAIAADAQGAVFGLFAPISNDPSREARTPSGAGQVSWRELYTSDPTAAFAFYANLFGWEKDHAFDMGPAGPYQLFSIDGQPAGGIMRASPTMVRSVWNPFVQVEDIASMESRVMARKGRVFDGAREVPGGDWTVKCFDPKGAVFALTGRMT